MQDHTQVIDCGCGDGFPVSHTAKSIAADAVVVYEGVFCYAFFFHCLPKVIVVDHAGHLR